MDNDLLTWADMILTAVLERRDATTLVDLAYRAGVDLDVLQFFINNTLDAVRDNLMGAAGLIGFLSWPEIEKRRSRITTTDVEVLKDLGINAD